MLKVFLSEAGQLDELFRILDQHNQERGWKVYYRRKLNRERQFRLLG